VPKRPKILFVCTANAARSQMAEGLLRAKYGEYFEVFSAGTRLSRISPYAILVMHEIGIDISNQYSKTLQQIEDEEFDVAVTLCDRARDTCPVIHCAKKQIHRGFSDPHFSQDSNGDILDGYRRIRDEISTWIGETFNPEKRNFRPS